MAHLKVKFTDIIEKLKLFNPDPVLQKEENAAYKVWLGGLTFAKQSYKLLFPVLKNISVYILNVMKKSKIQAFSL